MRVFRKSSRRSNRYWGGSFVILEPKILILDLVMVRYPKPCSVRELLQAARLFQISDNSLRVAVTRLVAQHWLKSEGRGLYGAGEQIQAMSQEIRSWRYAQDRIRAWTGHFLFAFLPERPKYDRTEIRHRARALGMMGFQDVASDIHVRPDNLRASLEEVRQRLVTLGMTADHVLVSAEHIAGLDEKYIKNLWPIKQLDQQYLEMTVRMRSWMQSARHMQTEHAARESFLLGREVIRQINRDPWLPEDWIDASSRQTYFETAIEFDRYGWTFWMDLLSWPEKYPSRSD